jgi:ring-1,2-phenylacetyl-CoA epoxidase subunit PaaC
MLLQRLTQSSDQFLREFAHKAVKEVAYHRELASEWTVRLGDGTEESARRTAEGLDWNWRFVPELFEVDEGLQAAIEAGIASDPRTFEDEYRTAIGAVLAEAKLEPPVEQRPILGGRRGHHSEHLGHLLAVMQFLPRTYPDAAW